jgi:hypothetical protein
VDRQQEAEEVRVAVIAATRGALLTLGLAGALTLAGCLGSDNRAADFGPPAWYGKPPQEEGRLFAVGAADDHDGALARAQQDLVSQLRLSIKSSTTHSENYSSQEATGTDRAERLAQNARSKVQAKASAEDLPGVTVVEQIVRSGTTYVLLRLDRQAWATELRNRIAALDALLPSEAAAVAALPATTPAQRLAAAGAHIRRLLPLLVERDENLTRLRTALPGSPMPPDVVDRGALDRRLSNLLADLSVVLPADPSVAPLTAQLIESLRAVGLRTVDPHHTGVLQLPLVLTTRSETIDGQIRLDGQLTGSLRLSPEAGGTQLGGISLTERASSARPEVARERLYQKLALRLAEDLDARLTRMLAGN